MAKYYLDTSIWLDLLEDRNEPNLPKGKYAENFIARTIETGEKIVYSDTIKDELIKQGYMLWELEDYFGSLGRILLYVESNAKQFKRAKDLASKRKVPVLDALHGLIARDNHAIVITRDKDFARLNDIAKAKRPEEVT